MRRFLVAIALISSMSFALAGAQSASASTLPAEGGVRGLQPHHPAADLYSAPRGDEPGRPEGGRDPGFERTADRSGAIRGGRQTVEIFR